MKRKTEPAYPSTIENVFQDQSPAQRQAPSTTGTPALDTVLVHLGYDYKLISDRNVFLTVLEAGCLRSWLSSAESPHLACRLLSSCCIFTGRKAEAGSNLFHDS